MKSIIIATVFVALLWGGWPLLFRAAGNTGAIGSLLVALAAIVPISLIAMTREIPDIPSNAIWKLFAAGTMMGAGLVAYNTVATSPLINISVVVPVVNTLMLIVTVLGGMYFFSEHMSFQRGFGIAFIILGIVLLRPGQS